MEPQAIEAEQALLGAMMLDAVVCERVLRFTRPEHFYRPAHSEIFRAIRDVMTGGSRADVVTVTNTLRREEKLKGVGGASYVIELLERVPVADHGMHYARVVAEQFELREIQRAGTDPELTADPKRFYATVDKIRQDGYMPEEGKVMSEHIVDAMTEMETVRTSGIEISTGFPRLDQKIGGLRRGQLFTIGGRPSTGKTAFCCNIALAVAKQGKKVVFICLEQNPRQLVKRMIAIQQGINAHHFLTGALSDDEWTRAAEFGSLGLDDRLFLPAMERADTNLIERELARRRPDVMIVDQLQLLKHGAGQNEPMEIAKTVRELKLLGVHYDCAMILCSQIRLIREHETAALPRPHIWQLYGSGGIEQFSQVVGLMYWPWHDGNPDKPDSLQYLYVDKNSDGPVAALEMSFNSRLLRFTEIEEGA